VIIPDKQRATLGDAFSGTARRAGTFFRLTALSVPCLERPNRTLSALSDEKSASGRDEMKCQQTLAARYMSVLLRNLRIMLMMLCGILGCWQKRSQGVIDISCGTFAYNVFRGIDGNPLFRPIGVSH